MHHYPLNKEHLINKIIYENLMKIFREINTDTILIRDQIFQDKFLKFVLYEDCNTFSRLIVHVTYPPRQKF